MIQLILFLFIFATTPLAAQNFSIHGRVKNAVTQIAIVNATVDLIRDSTQTVAKTVTNAQGDFAFHGLPSASYRITVSSIGYEPTQAMVQHLIADYDAGTLLLHEESTTLQEVKVTSDMLRSYGNHDEIYLSKREREVGSNALDAISALPQFHKGIDDKLYTALGSTLLIVIDDRRATEQQLMMLRAEDVAKLAYYSNPPVRYAQEGVGAVLEVKTRKKKERNYFFYLNTKNSFTTGYGTDQASFSYTDSLNQLYAAYFIDYRGLRDNRMNNSYRYGETENIYEGSPGKYSGQYHIGLVSYQRNIKRNVLYAMLEYRANPGLQHYSQSFSTLLNRQQTQWGSSDRVLRSNYDGFTFDLYFMHPFTEHRSFSVNVVNTFFTSKSDNIFLRAMLEPQATFYLFENNIKNRSYSFIGETLCTDEALLGGKWNVGAYVSYKNLLQTSSQLEDTKLHYLRGYFYTDFSKTWGNLSSTFGIGLDDTQFTLIDGTTHNYLLFRPLLSLNYNFTKRSSLRYYAAIQPTIPEMGELTNSIVTIEDHFFATGNPALATSHTFHNQFTWQYRAGQSGKVYLSPSAFFDYRSKPQASVLMTDGSDVYKTYLNIGYMKVYGAALNLTWQPWQWLNLQPHYQYSFYDYATSNARVRHIVHSAGGSVQVVYKEFQFYWFANLPLTTVDGDIYEKMGFQTAARVTWKHENFTVGAEWLHNPHPSEVYGKLNNFNFDEETVWNNFRHLIDIQFTYRFSIGKEFHHAQKRISNSDNDTGLTKDNTAK